MNNALAPVSYTTEKGSEIVLSAGDVRNYLVSGKGNVTDSEIVIFMHQMKANQLDPFAKDAWLIKYSNDSPASIVLGKDAFVKRADNHPQYDGMDSGIALIDNNKLHYRKGTMILPGEVLAGGWCEVYRKDRTHPTRKEVSLSEYNTGKSNWSKMPATMICKVATSQAQREAFPNQFAGFYDESEISESRDSKPSEARIDESVVEIEAEVINEAPAVSEFQQKLGNTMREAKEMGIMVSGIKSRIASELGRNIEELNDHECEKAVAIISSLIADKAKLEATKSIDEGITEQTSQNYESGAIPALYEEDVPF